MDNYVKNKGKSQNTTILAFNLVPAASPSSCGSPQIVRHDSWAFTVSHLSYNFTLSHSFISWGAKLSVELSCLGQRHLVVIEEGSYELFHSL